MLYGRRLDESLEHVDGSRYALVHAVAKRARQITLWLTADPAELRAESAPPPAPGELDSRDPVALAEAEILKGDVGVRWDPEGLEEQAVEQPVEEDPLLLESIDDDEGVEGVVDLDSEMTPALSDASDAEDSEPDAEDLPEASGDGEASASDDSTDEDLESLDVLDEGDDEEDEDS